MDDVARVRVPELDEFIRSWLPDTVSSCPRALATARVLTTGREHLPVRAELDRRNGARVPAQHERRFVVGPVRALGHGFGHRHGCLRRGVLRGGRERGRGDRFPRVRGEARTGARFAFCILVYQVLIY